MLVSRGKPEEEELHAVRCLDAKLLTDDAAEFQEWTGLMETCLWGNATDLSLLTSLTHEDIQALQSVERGSDFILKNDFKACWSHVRTLKNARIDIVLDNVRFFPCPLQTNELIRTRTERLRALHGPRSRRLAPYPLPLLLHRRLPPQAPPLVRQRRPAARFRRPHQLAPRPDLLPHRGEHQRGREEGARGDGEAVAGAYQGGQVCAERTVGARDGRQGRGDGRL